MTPEIWKMVQDLIPQAKSEAWRAFQPARHAVDREELESIAYLGLMQAASRWEGYCARNSFSAGCGKVPCEDPETCGTRYFGAYATRRMRGAILDHLRASDWVPRAVRQRAKALRDAGEDTGASEADLAARSGLTVREVRDTRSAVAQRPVSIDDGERDVAARADTESQFAATGILQAVVLAMRRLPVSAQVVLAMRYFEGRELKDCARVLGIPEDEVSRMHGDGIMAVHTAMAEAAMESA